MIRNIKKNIRNPRRGHRGKAELGMDLEWFKKEK